MPTSHTRDALLPVLQAVPRIREALWLDEQNITIGDRFHDKIQAALPAARVGILLVSNTFLTSDYSRSPGRPGCTGYAASLPAVPRLIRSWPYTGSRTNALPPGAVTRTGRS